MRGRGGLHRDFLASPACSRGFPIEAHQIPPISPFELRALWPLRRKGAGEPNAGRRSGNRGRNPGTVGAYRSRTIWRRRARSWSVTIGSNAYASPNPCSAREAHRRLSLLTTPPRTGTRHVLRPRSSSHAYSSPVVCDRNVMHSWRSRSSRRSGAPWCST